MNKYAYVETGGKQYKFEAGKSYQIEKLPLKVGDKVTFDKVLSLHQDDGQAEFSMPFIPSVKIKATVVEHFKDKKVKIIKFKRRKHYMKTQGHRQQLMTIKVDAIEVK